MVERRRIIEEDLGKNCTSPDRETLGLNEFKVETKKVKKKTVEVRLV